MDTIKGEVKVEHKLANTSEYYLLVGNCDNVISAHSSEQEAAKALNNQADATVKWADVQIVAPGQTVTGQYTRPVVVDDARPFDWSAFVAEA